ncbi:MAG: hypothetical protein LWW96_00635 [Acidovorax sp.]|uniref:hypothetical protein n=1 Tax=Acidovorax sp. TaxID=1872122 RepID=UPI0025C49922|nr:hypothetical protein [Acidovorax sp.]MCE1190636.1 hypothetical protein [Acidovorax sp.]
MTRTTQGNRSLPVWKRLLVWLVLVSFTQASVAQAALGDTFKNSEAPVQNLLAHAVLGCATGVVKSRGDGQGCAAALSQVPWGLDRFG